MVDFDFVFFILTLDFYENNMASLDPAKVGR